MPSDGISDYSAEGRKGPKMTLLAEISKEEFDKLNDVLKAEYKDAGNGKFRPDVQEVNGVALEDVTGLKSSLAKTLEREKSSNKKVKELETLVSEKDIALADAEELAKNKLDGKSKEQIEALRKQLTDNHAKEIALKEKQINELSSGMKKTARESAIADALSKCKIAPDAVEPMKSYLRERLVTDIDNEQVVLKVVQNGEEQVDNSGKPMSVEGYVEGLRKNKAFAPFFLGTKSSGGGTPPGGTPPGGQDLSKMNPTEKLKLARQQKT